MMDRHIRQIEGWLYAYPVWQKKLQSLRAQLDDHTYTQKRFVAVASFSKGTVGDPTQSAAVKRVTLQKEQIWPLEFRIRLLENALLVLTEEESALVRMRYFERQNNAVTWEALFLSRRAFFRRRVAVLEKLYEALGGDDAIIWEDTKVTRSALR